MKRAPSKESEEEEILSLGEGRRLRGEAPGKSGVWGAAFSGPSVGPEPPSTALPQEGQKRAAPGTSLPQAGQLMAGAGVYHCPLPASHKLTRDLADGQLWRRGMGGAPLLRRGISAPVGRGGRVGPPRFCRSRAS